MREQPPVLRYSISSAKSFCPSPSLPFLRPLQNSLAAFPQKCLNRYIENTKNHSIKGYSYA